MVAALRTAGGKQPFCRFVAIGTRPADESHCFGRLLDGVADYAQVHAASDDDPPFRGPSVAPRKSFAPVHAGLGGGDPEGSGGRQARRERDAVASAPCG